MTVGSAVRGFIAELRRRRVVRVSVVYGVVAWLMVQVAATVGPALALPDWTDSFVVLMALVGFPLALILAWAYDITPDGVRRTEAGSEAEGEAASPSTPTTTGKAIVARAPGARRAPVKRPGARAQPPPRPPAGEPVPLDLRRAVLATLRHELRTPLNAIIGYGEFLLEDLPPEQSGPVRAILMAGQRHLALVNEILRPDAAEEELTDEMLGAMRRRIREEMSGPSERLVELCGEARTVVAGAEAVSLEDLDRLTEAAVRLRDLVRSEMEAPEGPDGAGALSGPTREIASRVIAGLPRGASPGEDAPPRHGQILVVDDNEDNRELLSRQLARQGFSVALVQNGEEALDALREQDFDLVLLDVLMPGMDGIEVLERMQGEPETAEIPVIMTSALDEIEGVVRCIEQGAVDYLIKPFDPVLLQARIGATLDLYRLRAQQRRARQELDQEIAWSERLVHSLVPVSLAERVRQGTGTIVEEHEAITVVAVTIQGLGTFATRRGAPAAGEWMSATMFAFEALAAELPVEIRWEAGATLIATAGAEQAANGTPDAAATLALRIREEGLARCAGAEPVRVGIGIHTGPAVSALLGGARVAYGLWGEAADVARELAWRCAPGAAHVSPAAHAALHDSFTFEALGIIETSSRSQMRVYELVGPREAPAARAR